MPREKKAARLYNRIGKKPTSVGLGWKAAYNPSNGLTEFEDKDQDLSFEVGGRITEGEARSSLVTFLEGVQQGARQVRHQIRELVSKDDD